MTYSNTHKDFAWSLNRYYNISEQDVLDYPENYLGPNYRELLNFWFYRNLWSIEQIKIYCERCNKLDREALNKAYDLAKNLALEVIDPRFIIFPITGAVELEIIAAHFYFERNIPFTFIPLIFDL
jgi:hypothetical protein